MNSVKAKRINERQKLKMDKIRSLGGNKRLAILRLDQFSQVHCLRSRREAERKGTIHLLQLLFGDVGWDLVYLSNGKPVVRGVRGGISISHSHDVLGILHDSERSHTGLDIELIREKVLKIRYKFLSEKEKKFIPDDNVKMHIMAWCAKETLYKIHSEGMLDFIQHLHLHDFSENDESVFGACTAPDFAFEKELRVEQIENYIMTWPVN